MLSVIVAISKNYVIGNGGKIPWKIKGEQRRFKELTTGHTIIMGRRSFQEIGHPLANRRTILISKTFSYEDENCTTAGSLQEALKLADPEHNEVYIAGGAMLYKEALPLADRLYVTHIELEVEGDTYFPEFDRTQYLVISEESIEGEIPYTYTVYERIVKDTFSCD